MTEHRPIDQITEDDILKQYCFNEQIYKPATEFSNAEQCWCTTCIEAANAAARTASAQERAQRIQDIADGKIAVTVLPAMPVEEEE